MFSYQNKVVGIKITDQVGSDLFDLLVNSGYVGSITGSGQGDGAYLIASNDTSLSLEYVYDYLTGYPTSIFYSTEENYYTAASESGFAYNLGGALSGYYTGLGGDMGGVYSLIYTGDNWKLQYTGQTGILAEGGPDPSNPYGSYTGGGWYLGNTIVTISKDLSIEVNQTPTYYFSDLLLNEGQNQLCFINTLNNASGNRLNYEVNSYELSGSYLVSPSLIQTGEITPATGTNECIFFDLAYPTGIDISEFDPFFDVDTGNLNQIFTGSGVHLQKDVTFFFDILDQQLNTVSSNQQFIENPLISGCVFDVLNINGTTAFENFFTGKYSRSVTVSALDNENIFGNYQKDFGVRCKLPNTFDGSIFTGVFLAYGNLPNIIDVVPNYAEFSGAPQATESFSSSIVLQNNLKFIQMDRYDVYALTQSGSAVNELTFLNPTAQEGYLFSQSATNVSDSYTLTINKGNLLENTPYYFTVVPYGALGSGNPFLFGPTTFVPKQIEATVFPISDVSSLNVYDGTGFSSTVYKTGVFTNNANIIHTFSGDYFSSVSYLVEIFEPALNYRQFSELKGVIDFAGPVLLKNTINDTYTDYSLTGISGASGSLLVGLLASGNNPGLSYAGYNYKLHATMI
jgi:hypothetical protein